MVKSEGGTLPPSDAQRILPYDDPAWLEAERALWWAISCRDFSKRQKRVLMFILKESIGRGRGKAYVSSLESFNEYLRLQISHVSETLKFLKAKRVIAEYPEYCYGFRFPIDGWDVKVLPERIYHEEQLVLIEAPPELEDALREVFIDDIKNLPARGRFPTAVHPNRSSPGPGPDQGKLGGVVSREPAGSVPDDQAEATGRAHDPQGRAPTSPEVLADGDNKLTSPFPESGKTSRIGKLPGEGGFPNRETPKNPIATAKSSPNGPPFPESGNDLQYSSTGNAPTEHYCNGTSTKGFPESGNAEPHGQAAREMQHCNSGQRAGKKKFRAEQQDLFDELQALRGNGGKRLPVFGEKNEWFGFWVISVRDRFEITQELLGDLKYKMVTDVVDDPGAWMMFKWKSWGKPQRR